MFYLSIRVRITAKNIVRKKYDKLMKIDLEKNEKNYKYKTRLFRAMCRDNGITKTNYHEFFDFSEGTFCNLFAGRNLKPQEDVLLKIALVMCPNYEFALYFLSLWRCYIPMDDDDDMVIHSILKNYCGNVEIPKYKIMSTVYDELEALGCTLFRERKDRKDAR